MFKKNNDNRLDRNDIAEEFTGFAWMREKKIHQKIGNFISSIDKVPYKFELILSVSIYAIYLNFIMLEALWIKEKGEFPFNGKCSNL